MRKTRLYATAAASAALVVSMAGPAFAGGDTGTGGLQISPASGGPGTHVEVKALCRDGGHGTVASDAFESSQAHTDRYGDDRADAARARHRSFATAKVMHEGLTPGKKYQVTGYCRNHQPLTGTFTYTGVSGGARAGLGGLASGTGNGTPATATAAALAGGLAAAGAAGYLLVWRRRAAGDQA
ncbi:hypothetical protein V1J52_17090 [Streptomyces sp. TRM 70351]|uniref:hypothetical protein n=1 Tax=Streptomyces sp. TRM 70351 TaxID=3116552 RepID=UPI002E7C37A1|nr:hypothetical protein [Streptomyces sp. TRM 70351]MEE1929875.1 hypothetical protein [Streptomyces sp. TRM 70351]